MPKMYEERKANIAVFRGCNFNCVYCAFQRMLKLSKCQKCKEFAPHMHLEALDRTPPKTREGEFLTIGLSGDVAFMDWQSMLQIFAYCQKWKDRTFLIQSKDPGIFALHDGAIPKNLIIGTTIESNRLTTLNKSCFYKRTDGGFEPISQAPSTQRRYYGMLAFNARKSVTIEPVLDFDIDVFAPMIYSINPEIVWIGYDSHPEKNRLPEPTIDKLNAFIDRLKHDGINVHTKLIREPIRTDG